MANIAFGNHLVFGAGQQIATATGANDFGELRNPATNNRVLKVKRIVIFGSNAAVSGVVFALFLRNAFNSGGTATTFGAGRMFIPVGTVSPQLSLSSAGLLLLYTVDPTIIDGSANPLAARRTIIDNTGRLPLVFDFDAYPIVIQPAQCLCVSSLATLPASSTVSVEALWTEDTV